MNSVEKSPNSKYTYTYRISESQGGREGEVRKTHRYFSHKYTYSDNSIRTLALGKSFNQNSVTSNKAHSLLRSYPTTTNDAYLYEFYSITSRRLQNVDVNNLVKNYTDFIIHEPTEHLGIDYIYQDDSILSHTPHGSILYPLTQFLIKPNKQKNNFPVRYTL